MFTSDCLIEVLNINYVPGFDLIRKSTFDVIINDQAYDNCTCLLFQNGVIIKVKTFTESVDIRINFDFDLIFQFLRSGATEKAKIHGDPHAIKLERNQKCLLLRTHNNAKELIVWADTFHKRLNERGFHELFKPIKKIGSGNFATVYLVIKHEDGKKYAVKAFYKESAYEDDRGKQALINEIQVMRSLNHKNLMKIYGVYETDHSLYLSVQLLQGGNLYDRINTKHSFAILQMKKIMKSLLEGVQYLHHHNIMHRDLKPENILFRKQNDCDCVIADFGLSQSTLKEEYLFMRCGTPGYVAPEIANLKDKRVKYGVACDIFSLGVIFHMLIFRKTPFPGTEYDEVLYQNRMCKINFQTSQYKSLPFSWLNLLKRMLQKDPSKRITATQALHHQFFEFDSNLIQIYHQKIGKRESVDMSRDGLKMANQCESPLMMTKNIARKKQALARDDSCLKFKMKQNLILGKSQSNNQVLEINSPELKNKQNKMRVTGTKSRFKKQTLLI